MGVVKAPYKYYKSTHAWDSYEPPVERWRPDDATYDKTLQRKIAPGKPVEPLFMADETIDKYNDWVYASTADHTLSEVPTEKTEFFLLPSEGTPAFYNEGGLTAARFKGKFNFRDYGKLVTGTFDVQKSFEDMMQSDTGYQLAAKHSKELKNMPDLEWVATGTLPGHPEGIYAVIHTGNNKAGLFGRYNSLDTIDEMAGKLGINTKELNRRYMGEEMGHMMMGTKVPRVKQEVMVRQWLYEVYDSLANSASNPSDKAKYRKIANLLAIELSNAEAAYSKIYANEDPGKLEKILRSEAVENGALTEEQITSYVSEVMAAYCGNQEKTEATKSHMAQVEDKPGDDSAPSDAAE